MNKKETQNNAAHLREGNISIILDSYDDLFSDFDPRGYKVKALSDDFILECKRAASEKKDKLELRFFVPEKKRNLTDEGMIKKRIREHFQRSYKEKKKEINKIRASGLLWFVLGTLVIVGGTFLYPYRVRSFFFTLLFIVSEPASWFFFWEGLSKIFITSRKQIPDYIFCERMSNADVYFLSY